jgi:hypothetical protein
LGSGVTGSYETFSVSRQNNWTPKGPTGQNHYAIFIEPDAAQLELDGKAHFLASIGETVGMADYTTFMATDKYIGAKRRCRAGPTGSPGR